MKNQSVGTSKILMKQRLTEHSRDARSVVTLVHSPKFVHLYFSFLALIQGNENITQDEVAGLVWLDFLSFTLVVLCCGALL